MPPERNPSYLELGGPRVLDLWLSTDLVSGYKQPQTKARQDLATSEKARELSEELFLVLC